MSKHYLQAGPSSAHSQLIRVGNREVQRWYYWSSDQCSSVLDFILEAPTTRIGDFWRKPIFGQCMLPQLKPQRPQWLHCHPLSACLGCKGLGEGSSVTSNEHVINGVCRHAQRLPDTFTWKPRGRRQSGRAQEGSEVVFIGVIVEVSSLIRSPTLLLPGQVSPYTLPQVFTHSLIYLAPHETTCRV